MLLSKEEEKQLAGLLLFAGFAVGFGNRTQAQPLAGIIITTDRNKAPRSAWLCTPLVSAALRG